MSETSHLKKILWAVDVFDPNKKILKTASKVLQALRENTGATLEVVHILNLNETKLSNEIDGPWEDFYRQAAENALKRVLAQIPGLTETMEKDAHVILQRTSTTSTEGVNLLIRYAEAREADLIVVSTHGRSGVKRAFLGSFAETLLLRSSIPVVTVGPEMVNTFGEVHLETLIFPTDFAYDARLYFRQAVLLAKQLKTRLLLFHTVPHPIEPVIQSGVNLLGGSWVPLFSYFGEQVDHQTRRAQAWVRWANHQGVEAEFQINSQGGSIVDSLVELAQQREDSALVMVEKAGPLASALLGSITRQVVRHACCPVWTLRPLMVLKKLKEPISLKKAA